MLPIENQLFQLDFAGQWQTWMRRHVAAANRAALASRCSAEACSRGSEGVTGAELLLKPAKAYRLPDAASLPS